MDYKNIEISILNQKENDISRIINKKGINNIHIDIMDGYFTESLSSINPFLLNNLDIENKKLHLHFMVNDIYKYYNHYSHLKNIEYLSYHFESNYKKNEYIKFNNNLRYKGIKVGLAINPNTEINEISKIIEHFDFILIMTVIPGKGGQSFIEKCGEKIKKFKSKYKKIPIFIDGGVNNIIYEKYNNIVDRFIIGSYLYKN